MGNLEDSFEKLLGKQPTDADKQQLYRVRDALDLKNNDALWLVLMALQHYQSQYVLFPELIAKAAKETLGNVKTTADAAIKASTAAAKADLSEAVANAATEVAQTTARKQMWQWAAGCMMVATVAIGVLSWGVFVNARKAGYASGYGAGYNAAKDEKAAAAWSSTPEGKMAFRLAQAGSIRDLASCNRPGWYIKKGTCYVQQDKDGNIWGWGLP